jgi:peroxiredoxin
MAAVLTVNIAGLALIALAVALFIVDVYAPTHGILTGLTLDLTGRGMGVRSTRYSMLVKDGKVQTLNLEAPGKFEVSDADTLLAQAKG